MTHAGNVPAGQPPLTAEQQKELSELIMSAMVSKNLAGPTPSMTPEQLQAQLAGCLPPVPGAAPQPSPHGHAHGIPAQPPVPQASPDVVKKMDTDETLRLENLLLRDQMEKMHQQLEEMRREIAKRDMARHKDGLQDYLHEKHSVDRNTHRLIIDAQAHSLTITPLDTEQE
jgi:hypothetical protein